MEEVLNWRKDQRRRKMLARWESPPPGPPGAEWKRIKDQILGREHGRNIPMEERTNRKMGEFRVERPPREKVTRTIEEP